MYSSVAKHLFGDEHFRYRHTISAPPKFVLSPWPNLVMLSFISFLANFHKEKNVLRILPESFVL